MSGWPSGRSLDGGIDEIPLDTVSGRVEGRLWLCGKHVVGPDPEAALARVGATGIVCFNERHELADRYPGYTQWLGEQPRARAVWFPTPDLGVRPLDEFVALVDDTLERLRSGARLIAHCGAGIGRAGTFAIGVLVAAGVSAPDAAELVARHRPMAGPEAGTQTELVHALVRLR